MITRDYWEIPRADYFSLKYCESGSSGWTFTPITLQGLPLCTTWKKQTVGQLLTDVKKDSERGSLQVTLATEEHQVHH